MSFEVAGKGKDPTLPEKLAATVKMSWMVLRGRWDGVSRLRILASWSAVVYLISPLDVIPELAFGPFGLIDDAAIAALAVGSLLAAGQAWLKDTGSGRSESEGELGTGLANDQGTGS